MFGYKKKCPVFTGHFVLRRVMSGRVLPVIAEKVGEAASRYEVQGENHAIAQLGNGL